MRFAVTIAAVLVLVGVAGCTPDPPPVFPPDPPSTTPLFSSDDEALAAATEAYSSYLKVIDAIFADGGSGIDRLSDVATQGVVDQEVEGFEDLVANGRHGVGTTSFDSVTIQQFNPATVGPDVLLVYVCEDLSDVDIIGADGNSVVVDGRVNRWPMVIGFGFENEKFLVTSVEDWTGGNFCD